jgi:hypothetical protein
MIKKYLSIFCFAIIYFLFFILIFSYSYLNWKEDIFLFAWICIYTSGRLFKRTTSDIWDNFLPFLLIFLLSQFYIKNFHPESVRWWFASVPGWLTVITGYIGVVCLVYQQILIKSTGTDDRGIQVADEALRGLLNKAIPGVIVVSAASILSSPLGSSYSIP